MGWATSFGISPEAALYDYSYPNLVLMGASLPSYDDDKDTAPEYDPALDADNPDNFKDIPLTPVTDY